MAKKDRSKSIEKAEGLLIGNLITCRRKWTPIYRERDSEGEINIICCTEKM